MAQRDHLQPRSRRPRRAPSPKPASQRLHVVDLNGAFAGRSVNGAAVDAILAATDVPVQLGGGIRDMAAIEAWLDQRHRPRHPRHGRGARSGAGQGGGARLSRPGRRRHRRARRQGGGRAAGPRRPRWTPSSSPGASRTPASRRSSTPTSSATACSRASTSPRRWRSPTRCDPGHRLGRPRLACRYRAAARAGLRDPGRRHRRPRAL